MKILHTSDLHLGAKTENVSRIAEQRAVLSEIVDICDKNQVDIVAIAGDVFHTSTPSAEAEDLFYDFLEKLTKDDNRVVLVVAGNHDDPVRLACCLPLAKRHNIVIASDLSLLPKYQPHGSVQIVETGRGFVKIKKGDEVVNAALLPYPIESRIVPSLGGETAQEDNLSEYWQKVAQWANLACKKFDESAFNMLVTHLYLAGAQEPVEDEKNKNLRAVVLGEAMAVPADVLPKCNYVAVGHLHTTHSVKCKNSLVYYSGAISKLRHYDGLPKVLVLDTKSCQPKEVALCAACNVVCKSVKEENIFKDLEKIDKNTLVYLNIINSQSLPASVVKEIRVQYPNVLCIRFVKPQAYAAQSISAKSLSDKDLFIEFYTKKRQVPPKEQLVSAFLSLLEEKNEA